MQPCPLAPACVPYKYFMCRNVGKKADTLLPRQERQHADANGAAREESGGDTVQTHALLTSGFFSGALLAPHAQEHLSKELEDQVPWGFLG